MESKEKKENTLYAEVELTPLSLVWFGSVRHGIKIIIKIYVYAIHLSSIYLLTSLLLLCVQSVCHLFSSHRTFFIVSYRENDEKKTKKERRIKRNIVDEIVDECVCV